MKPLLRHVGRLSAASLGIIFVLTIWFPAAPGLRSLYVLPILIAGLGQSFRHLWILASGATLLILLNAAPLENGSAAAIPIVLDLSAPTAMLWLATMLVGRYRRETEQRLAASAASLQAERALSQSRKDLENMKYAIDQSAIVATTDVSGTITYVNDTFCRISKYSREELIGRNHRIVNSGLHPLEFFRQLYSTISSGRVWRGEIRNRAKDGSFYWVDTTIVPLIDERRKPYQYIAIRHDITERKKSETALRDQAALAQLGRLAAVVAHEVRNPLAGIRGALQIIAPRMAAGGREQAIITEAVQRIDTLNEIVEDLLLFARPVRPALLPTRVPALVTETVALFKQDPTVAAVQVDVDVSDVCIMADARQVKQVLLNVLMNGAQAMRGEGRIRISTARAGETVEILVKDEGSGIPEQVREHLFEPFFTTRHAGTGLGLPTARRLLVAQGGSIRLECPDEGGTIAIVTLPEAAPQGSEPRPQVVN